MSRRTVEVRMHLTIDTGDREGEVAVTRAKWVAEQQAVMWRVRMLSMVDEVVDARVHAVEYLNLED